MGGREGGRKSRGRGRAEGGSRGKGGGLGREGGSDQDEEEGQLAVRDEALPEQSLHRIEQPCLRPQPFDPEPIQAPCTSTATTPLRMAVCSLQGMHVMGWAAAEEQGGGADGREGAEAG